MESICHRLSLLSEIHLPASMTRDRATAIPTVEIEEFLKGLLQRDPSVFLERYGSMLDPTELDCFSSLSSEHKSTVFSISCIGDYEVAFYLNKFAKTKEDVMDSNTLRVKNRRLAELDRLIAEGEYFGDTAMRDREPLLFQQYIAKFSQNLLSGQPRKPKSLSESLIQSAEEQELQERATAAAEEEEEKEEEEDEEFEEIEDEEFMRQEFVQIMKERFLTGKDGDYVDYNRIDNDACLDDDLLGIENQDKEEKYFQSDE